MRLEKATAPPSKAIAPPTNAPAAAAAFAEPVAITGGYQINSLFKIDQELEKIRLNKKRINNLLKGGNIRISDNSNFIPRANQQIVSIDTFSDSPTSIENYSHKSPISEYKQNLNNDPLVVCFFVPPWAPWGNMPLFLLILR